MRGEGLLKRAAIALAACVALQCAGLADDAKPVRLRIVPGGAREAPPEARDILFIAARPPRAEWTFDLPSVCAVSNGYQGRSWPIGGWKRPTYVFEYSGLLRIPETGEYVFHTQRPFMGPAYLFIDGEPVIDYPNRRPRWPRDFVPEWISGKRLSLEKGTVEFRAFGYCDRVASFPLAWSLGGSTNIVKIGAGLLRRADRLRHTGLDRPVTHIGVDCSIAGVSPFLFPEDEVRPELHVRSDADQVDVVVSATSRDGCSTLFAATSRVDIVRQWGRLGLPSWRAGDVGEISWSASVNGESLANGVTRFVHAPFDMAPTRAIGGALFAGDITNCVFVGRSTGPGTNPPATMPRTESVVVADCFGHTPPGALDAALSRVFGGVLPGSVSHVGCQDLVTDKAAMASYPWLAAIPRLCDSLANGVVVLLPDIGARDEDVAAFERRLGVVTGLLSEAGGRAVVLATPPPRAPIFGVERDMRPYAEAIHRVADLYGLAVADVYTLESAHPRH